MKITITEQITKQVELSAHEQLRIVESMLRKVCDFPSHDSAKINDRGELEIIVEEQSSHKYDVTYNKGLATDLHKMYLVLMPKIMAELRK